MRIQESFCPRCGRPSEGICAQCASGIEVPIAIAPRVECIRCPVCGMIREHGGWRAAEAREELAERLAVGAIHFAANVKERAFAIECRERSSNRTICSIEASGVANGIELSCSGETEIVWRKELCTRCSRRSGGYYEGVVQVRASGRACTPHEKRIALGIASAVESSLQETGDTLSYILRTDEAHGSLDIVVGTQSLGRLIASRIVERMGGSYGTHPKLVGEKNGIPIYRITYIVRLPRFQKGDVIESGGRYSEVREAGAKRVTLFDLDTGSTRVTRQEESWRLVGNVREAAQAMIAYRDGETIGIIEPSTGITREIRSVAWLPEESGKTVRVLVDRERETLIVVG